MNLNNFTIKAQEAVQKAQEIAVSRQHQAIETAHLLKGILTVDENVTPFLLKKMEVNVVNLGRAVDSLHVPLLGGQHRPCEGQPKGHRHERRVCIARAPACGTAPSW